MHRGGSVGLALAGEPVGRRRGHAARAAPRRVGGVVENTEGACAAALRGQSGDAPPPLVRSAYGEADPRLVHNKKVPQAPRGGYRTQQQRSSVAAARARNLRNFSAEQHPWGGGSSGSAPPSPGYKSRMALDLDAADGRLDGKYHGRPIVEPRDPYAEDRYLDEWDEDAGYARRGKPPIYVDHGPYETYAPDAWDYDSDYYYPPNTKPPIYVDHNSSNFDTVSYSSYSSPVSPYQPQPTTTSTSYYTSPSYYGGSTAYYRDYAP